MSDRSRQPDWSRLTPADWTNLIKAMLERSDLEHVPSVLAVMAAYHPHEAEELRQTMLLGCALAQEADRG